MNCAISGRISRIPWGDWPVILNPLVEIENGDRNYRQTINAIEAMDITEEDKKKIYEDNARNLMRLPI